MSRKQSNFKELERFLTMILLGNLALFVLFLIFSGTGVMFLKGFCAVLGILVSGFGLWLLNKTRELLRPRALWLTCGFACQAVLILVSLICNFPSPK